jgi:hypothetical protein
MRSFVIFALRWIFAYYDDKIMVDVMDDRVACVGDMGNVYTILIGKPERKIPFVGRRWKDNIKMAVREIGLEGADCILLAQDSDRWRALAITAMNLQVT